MAKSSLNQVVKSLKDTGKSKIGYATKQYEQVLKALKQNKEIIIQRVRAANGINPTVDTSMQYSTYSGITSTSWDTAVTDADGFLTQGDKFLYQGVLNTKCYGSFIAEGDLHGEGSKKYCISSNSSDIVQLMGDMGLPNELTRVNVVNSANKMGGKSPFKIGVALNFGKFVMPFFNKFFNQKNWDEGQLRSIASEGKMFAEISLSVSENGTQAYVIHTMVTDECTSQVQGTAVVGTDNQFVSSNNLLIPYSLLLLNDYNSLGNVTLQINGKEQKVNGSVAKFPFAGSHYNHLKGQIQGFYPDWITSYCADSQGQLNIFNNALVSSNVIGTNRARVRLYLAKNAADGLPNNEQLYKGHHDVTKTKVTQMGEVVSGQLIPGKLSVLVKPGHQSNKGAQGNGVYEKIVNEQVANKVMAVLQAKQYGCENILKKTPSGGAEYALSKKDVATCVISIHCNKGGGKGVVALYKHKNGFNGDSTRGHPLSEPLADKIGLKLRPILPKKKVRDAHKAHQPPRDSTGRRNDGFLRTIGTGMPAVLIELGFLDNKQDAAKLNSPQWQEKMAQAIVQGIEQWYTQYSNNNSTN